MAIDSYTLASGTKIGHFRVDTVLGRGCESEVYAATEDGSGAERVLKIFPLTDEITAEYVRTKASVFERLSDTQATPRFYGYGDVMLAGRASMYHMYERVYGVTLKQFIAEQVAGLSVREAFELVVAIADRLDRIHAHGTAVADFESCDNIIMAGRAPVFIDFYSGMPGNPNTYYFHEVSELEKIAKLLFQRHSESDELLRITQAIARYRHHANKKDIPFSLSDWLTRAAE